MLRILTAFALVVPSIAAAQKIELVERVEAGDLARPPNKSVGDVRYLAMSDLYPAMWDYFAQVYDLQTKKIRRVMTSRKQLTAKFGTACDVCDDGLLPPRAELVSYTPTRAGFAFYHIDFGPITYGEIDDKTGNIGRTKLIANAYFGDFTFIGTDPAANAAWFSIIQADPGRTNARQAVLKRLDLATLAISDEVTIPLRVRTSTTGYEDHRFFHHSPDWSRIVIVDYFEDGMKMSRGDIYVTDTIAKSSFAVKAPSTAYGIAFTPDGKHMFVGSCDKGRIFRLDLASQKFDREIAGVKLMHHLVVTPGSHLFALSSSSKYLVSDLGLDRRNVTAHTTTMESSFAALFGGGAWSNDGKFILLQDESREGSNNYILAKFVD